MCTRSELQYSAISNPMNQYVVSMTVFYSVVCILYYTQIAITCEKNILLNIHTNPNTDDVSSHWTSFLFLTSHLTNHPITPTTIFFYNILKKKKKKQQSYKNLLCKLNFAYWDFFSSSSYQSQIHSFLALI